MNTIREIQSLNERELEKAVPPEGSWHADYRDTAYIYIGGLSHELSEGDILSIFSQFGEPVFLNLIRDKETGKSKGFAFLKYEDQRSTDLAVDNLGGTTVLGRVLKVDHTRYKRKEDEDAGENAKDITKLMNDNESREDPKEGRRTRTVPRDGRSVERSRKRPSSREGLDLQTLVNDYDEDDPMKDYLIRQKEEFKEALSQTSKDAQKHGHRERRSHHNYKHGSRREDQKGDWDRHHSDHRSDGRVQRRQRSLNSDDTWRKATEEIV